MDELLKYFPHLSAIQQQQFAALGDLYRTWNERINVISRKDIEQLYVHHVLHSLAIARVIDFKPGTRILDLGTGGGFPGIPLAILFPECQFRLIDGTGKKIRVVQDVAQKIGLQNVEALHRRGEEETDLFHFVVSRAVMPLPDLKRLVAKNISKEEYGPIPNGILCLKGGDLQEELQPYAKKVKTYEISQWFADPWFNQKFVIYLPC